MNLECQRPKDPLDKFTKGVVVAILLLIGGFIGYVWLFAEILKG